MKKIVACIGILLIILFAYVNAETLKVVIDNNYPPYSFLNSSGQVMGICVDLWKKWEEVTGVKVQLIAVDWDKAIPMVESGKADVVDEIFYTKQRAQKLDYTEAYDKINTTVFFDKRLSGITSNLETLKGFRVGVKSGDYDATYLLKHGIDKLSYYPSYSQLVKAAVEGKIHIFVMDEPCGFYYLSKLNALDKFKHSQPLYTSNIYRAVKKGNVKILDLVQNGFSKIPPSYVKKTMKKWKGSLQNPPAWENFKVIVIAAVIIVALMIIFTVWNRLLAFAVKKKIEEIKLEAQRTKREKTKVAELSENLREVTEHLYKLNEKMSKMTKLISELSPFLNEKEFAKDVLNVALQFVPEADGGSFSIVKNGKWEFLAVSDNYDSTILNNLDLKAEWMYKVDKLEVINYILVKDEEIIPFEFAKKIAEIPKKKIVKSLVVPIKINGKYAGNFFLDAFEDGEFSEESKYMMEIFGKLVSSFFTIKRVNSLELEHQKELLKKITDLLEDNNPKSRGHSERVGIIACKIGKNLSLNDEEVEDLKWCGFIHDIGFVGVKSELQTKLDLFEEEVDLKKMHPIIGELIIDTSTLPKRYKIAIKHHHENYDGSGYPDGLKGEEIPLFSRIIAVANAFDELVKFKGISPKEAVEEIKRESGKTFDPEIVKAAVPVFEDFISKLRKK